jgi:hypothetical protein
MRSSSYRFRLEGDVLGTKNTTGTSQSMYGSIDPSSLKRWLLCSDIRCPGTLLRHPHHIRSERYRLLPWWAWRLMVHWLERFRHETTISFETLWQSFGLIRRNVFGMRRWKSRFGRLYDWHHRNRGLRFAPPVFGMIANSKSKLEGCLASVGHSFGIEGGMLTSLLAGAYAAPTHLSACTTNICRNRNIRLCKDYQPRRVPRMLFFGNRYLRSGMGGHRNRTTP